ncbi:integral membrane mpv17 pmp22 [Colletotrichum truncatum]|uniref:Integral membrane mpv17 pmp22 n=1 Tax=Colletotrichum truncatum TaxID=5467 RepID=A0ACC3Z0W7_COLTU|nr:integral membrane mpv17 pmp22 [Colletotrichum truncatum]KAF6800497.1 integral membrane mpv17 pmp22 [Colletotrichum truncatum]
MAPPIVSATLQSAALAGTSNLLAQALTAYRSDSQLVIDWVPVFQFVLNAIVTTPPNFMWQEFLEESFPASHVSPTEDAVASAAANNEKELDREERENKLVEPKLNIRNTLIKLLLDQTVGSALNTIAFSMFMGSIQTAMSRPQHLSSAQHSVAFLLSRGAINYGKVDWKTVIARARADFWPLYLAGLKLWPLISFINFTFIKSIEGRNLVGALAGVVWGIYVSLFAAQ